MGCSTSLGQGFCQPDQEVLYLSISRFSHLPEAVELAEDGALRGTRRDRSVGWVSGHLKSPRTGG